MEDKSWIKLYRKILKSPIWDNEKALKIWIWCLVKATHKDRVQLVGRQEIALHKGQFVFGRKKASEELNMNESMIYRYIKLLEELQMLKIESNNKFSVVTIEKWGDYQMEDLINEQQVNNNVFDDLNNKRTAENEQNDWFDEFENIKLNNKYMNNKPNNKFSAVSIEKWEDYQFNEKELNNNSNNKRTTNEHKQECKEIYINLYNKYKAEIEKASAKEKLHIISKCKQCEEYLKLSVEEQEDLFYDLMKIDKRYKYGKKRKNAMGGVNNK